ncbi:hypothetical protein ACFLYW_01870 [Thermodesulfobacteriota bacterium]
MFASDSTVGSFFGNSVDIDGDYIIVGAVYSDVSGAAYIFKREENDWIEQIKLTSGNNNLYSSFGNSVSIHNGLAVVGHPRDDTLGANAGSAHLYKLTQNGWIEQTKLFPSDGSNGNYYGKFGHSVSIRNGQVIIGAIDDWYASGSAYIFKQNVEGSWTEQTKFKGANYYDNFGYSVAINDDYAVAGSIYNDHGFLWFEVKDTGAFYLFSKDDSIWNQKKIFDFGSDSNSSGAKYGFSVDIGDNTIIVGAPDRYNSAGHAFILGLPFISLTADPEYSPSGHSTLKWETQNVNNCTLEPGIGAVENIGFSEVIISEQTDYTLTCTNGAFGNISSTVTIQLGNPPPVIDFSIESDFINPGESTAMSWAVANATTCQLEPDLGTVDCIGSININPTETTLYTLTATGLGGSLSESLKVTVLNPLTIELLEPNGESDLADTNYEIQWQYTGAIENTTVSLYYDLDNIGEDGTLIESGIAIDDLFNTGTYNWDTLNIPEGKYYIYAVINDGLRSPITAYSAGPITVVHPSCSPGDIAIYNSHRQFDIDPDELMENDRFGTSFSITDDYAFVGSLRTHWIADNYGGGYQLPGLVFIYKRENNDWQFYQKIRPAESARNDRFGSSISASGNYAIIGAPEDDANGDKSGAAYIYKLENGQWVEQTKIVGLDTAENDRFGSSVFIDGDYAVIGAWGDDDKGSNSGAAYVFKRDGETWSQHTKLQASDGSSGDYFGKAVTISGDNIIVGNSATNFYFFRRNGETWAENSIIKSNSGGLYPTMSISGDYAIVRLVNYEDEGSVGFYIFKFNGSEWLKQTQLTLSDSSVLFGASVFIKGNFAIVGTGHSYDLNGNETYGAAYLFINNGDTWSEYQKITPCIGLTLTSFGRDVFLADNHAYVWSGENINSFDRLYETPIPLIATRINAEPKITVTGDTVLTWSATNADYCVIEPDIGPVEVSGSMALHLTKTTNFTIIASRENHIASAEVEVLVGVHKITPDDLTEMLKFGHSVAISGDYAVIGAPFDSVLDSNGTDVWRAGSVYVYKREGDFWVKQTQLFADEDLAQGYLFGSSIDISGDYIIIGSSPTDKANPGSTFDRPGIAYIFKREGTEWIKQARLTANNIDPNYPYISRYFGYSVAIEGDYAMVGNPKDNHYLAPNYGAGSVYVYKREGTTWVEVEKIIPNDALLEGLFGRSMEISGDYAILGAAKSAYIFTLENDQWVEQAKLIPQNSDAASRNGVLDVSIDGSSAVILQYENLDYDSPYYLKADIYELQNGQWTMQRVLEPTSNIDSKEIIRSSVSISNDFIVIGNSGTGGYYSPTRLGNVYVYKRVGDNWEDYSIFGAPEPSVLDYFGLSLSLSPSHLIVGASETWSMSTGSAYIFPLPTTYAEIDANPVYTPSGDTTLTWRTVNADLVTIEPDIGIVEHYGEMPISVSETTTFTITASGYYGTVTDEVTVTADFPPPSLEIDATENGLLPGQSTTISWSSENTDSLSINNGIGVVSTSGTITVSPPVTTTYTFTATGVGGQSISYFTILVYEPPGANLNITPSTPQSGEQFELSWNSVNGNYVTLTSEDFAGASTKHVAANGTETQAVITSTIYTLTVTGNGGIATDSVAINIPGSKPLISFSSEGTAVIQGNELTITWRTINADTVSIDNGIGEVSLNGTMVVSPEQTTTYTLTAVGPNGTSAASITINVIVPPTVSIGSIPESINLGESTTLHWTSENALMCSINQSIGYIPCSGTLLITPTETTTYTLTAYGSANTIATADVTVAVNYPEPTVQISALPQEIHAGETVILAWATSYADSCTIEPDIGTVACNGSMDITPSSSTIYTLIANGPGGTATSQVTVNILGPITIDIRAPADYETIYAPQATITGTVTPIDGYVIEEVGITVDGYPAQVNGETFFANNVPLAEGENAITVIATLPDGSRAIKSITVSSDVANSPGWVELSVNPESGIAPLGADLRVDLHLVNNLVSSSLSSDGPGVVDITQTGDFEYDLSFSFPGIYTLTYTATDDQNNIFEHDVLVNVLDRNELDTLLRAKWDGMKAALASGDVEGGLDYFLEVSQDRYRNIFNALQSELPQIVQNMQDVELIYAKNNRAKYRINQLHDINGNSVTITYYIYFIKDIYGFWGIEQF